jgi:hypothetical protein
MTLSGHQLLGGKLPFPYVIAGFKSNWGALSASGFYPGPTMLPLYFPSLSFNKSHLYPRVLLGLFHARMQGPRSSENTICH